MDTSGNWQANAKNMMKEAKQEIVVNLYRKIMMRMHDYEKDQEWEDVKTEQIKRCMSIVEEEAQLAWEEC